MSKLATGERWQRGKDKIATIRVRLHGVRHTIKMPLALTDSAADDRAKIVASIAYRMTLAKSDPAVGLKTLVKIGAAADGLKLKAACITADEAIAGWRPTVVSTCPTLDEVCAMWNGGTVGTGDSAVTYPPNYLATKFPNTVPVRELDTTIRAAKAHIAKNVPAHIRALPVDQITDEHADEIERGVAHIPRTDSRRQAMQPFKTLMSLCVSPLKLIKRSPVPEGWLPKKEGPRELQWLRPHEDTQLAACLAIPACWRVLWGSFTRNGAREEELMVIPINQFDLGERPTATLLAHQTKTKKRRFWSLGECVMNDPTKRGTECAEGMRRWVAMARANAAGTDTMFTDEAGKPIRKKFSPPKHARDFLRAKGRAVPKHMNLPALLRLHLEMAGIDRPELFATTASARNIVVHDLRATNVTVRKALGWTNAQIMRCTGHECDEQVNVYERDAQTLADVDAGNFRPLHEAIPELAGAAPSPFHASAPPVGLRLVSAPYGAASAADQPLPTTPTIHREIAASPASIVEYAPAAEPRGTTQNPGKPAEAGAPGPVNDQVVGQPLAALEARVEALQSLLLGGFAAEVSAAVMSQLRAAGVMPTAPTAAATTRKRRR